MRDGTKSMSGRQGYMRGSAGGGEEDVPYRIRYDFSFNSKNNAVGSGL